MQIKAEKKRIVEKRARVIWDIVKRFPIQMKSQKMKGENSIEN